MLKCEQLAKRRGTILGFRTSEVGDYDVWNRLTKMTYPDGEIITYHYNTGGQLESVKGTKSFSYGNNFIYNYVTNIGYDKFEQRNYMQYCNGAETFYTYEPEQRRLSNLTVTLGGNSGHTLLNNDYGYDPVGNVLGINSEILKSSSDPGTEIMNHQYVYDPLYRLTDASGTYTGNIIDRNASYSLSMSYDNLYNITSKSLTAGQQGIRSAGSLETTYSMTYEYEPEQPFRIASINELKTRSEDNEEEVPSCDYHHYEYDLNGNPVFIRTAVKVSRPIYGRGFNFFNKEYPLVNERKMLWDEENRLEAISINGYVSSYWYDSAGERVVKMHGDNVSVFVNDLAGGGQTTTTDFTAYVSPYTVVSPGGNYTKHIYIGGERIASKIGDITTYNDPRHETYASNPTVNVNYAAKYAQSLQSIKDRYEALGVPYYGTDNDDYENGLGFCCGGGSRSGGVRGNDLEPYQYYYHSDHLGSTTLITNLDGDVTQHVEYIPFGEVFFEERNSNWNSPFLFNAKELDEETGLYYYGARYYDPRTSVFLNPDPLQEKYPWVSTFAYCKNNPVNRVDPDGRDDYFNEDGTFSHSTKKGSDIYMNSVLLTKVDLNSKDNRQAMANVVKHYAEEVGITGVVGLKDNGKSSETSVAFTEGNKIYINKNNNKINENLHDANNMRSVLIHEKDHKSKDHGFTAPNDYQHAEVYFNQISDPGFLKTTKKFQEGILGTMAECMQNAANKGQENRVDDLMNKTNRIINKIGFNIGVRGQPVMIDGSPYYTIKVQPIKKK